MLYLDESGNHAEASYFVLAGLAVFEREIHWYTQDLDNLQKEIFPNSVEPIHFHARTLRTKQGAIVNPPWDQLPSDKRYETKNRIYNIIRKRRGVIFGCAIEKRFAANQNEDPYERALEDIMSRFDMYLSRMNREAQAQNREEQRGLVVIAQSSFEKTLTVSARNLRRAGTRWGQSHNVTDIPLFAPAQNTRLLQYADFCSNAIYGRYNSGLTKDFDIIAPKIDQDSGVLHGLAHLTTDPECSCIACFSRRNRQLQSYSQQ